MVDSWVRLVGLGRSADRGCLINDWESILMQRSLKWGCVKGDLTGLHDGERMTCMLGDEECLCVL